MSTMSLTYLPTEVLVQIGQCLERKDISRLSQVDKHTRAAIIPLLFSKLHESLNLRSYDWVDTALKSVNPDTWKHVKEVKLSVWVPQDPHPSEGDKKEFDDVKLQVRRDLWRTFFHYLGPLARLSIWIYDGSYAPESALYTVSSPYWLDYTGLTGDSGSLFELIPAASLEMDITCTTHNHARPEFMQHMLRPLKEYPVTLVRLGLAMPYYRGKTQSASQLAELFSGKWVSRLTLETFRQIELSAPFKNVSELFLSLSMEDLTVDFWQHLSKLSSDLQILDLVEYNLLGEAIPECPSSPDILTLPKLTKIRANTWDVSALAQMVAYLHLPALETIDIDLDCTYGTGTAAQRRFPRITIASLHALVQLDEHIPAHPGLKSRRYTLTLHGNLQEWQDYLRLLARLRPSSVLSLTAKCNLEDSATIWQAPSERGEDAEADGLAVVFPPGILATLVDFYICIESTTRSQPLAGPKMELPALIQLALETPVDNVKWTAHVIHQLFSSLSMPKLERLTFISRADRSASHRYLDIVELFLPLWPSLRRLDIKTYPDLEDDEVYSFSEVDDAVVFFDSLKEACEARNIDYTEGDP